MLANRDAALSLGLAIASQKNSDNYTPFWIPRCMLFQPSRKWLACLHDGSLPQKRTHQLCSQAHTASLAQAGWGKLS